MTKRQIVKCIKCGYEMATKQTDTIQCAQCYAPIHLAGYVDRRFKKNKR